MPIRDPFRRVKASARTRWPAAYGRARNTLALSHWIALRIRQRFARASPYDDAFWDFHTVGDWAGMADQVVEQFAPRSVVDVGCGQGLLLAALRTHHPSIDLLGIDSSDHAVRRARARGLDVRLADLAFLGKRDAAPVARLVRGADVAVCLETAEHLPPWSATNLVRALTGASVVVFSAAPPGQGGTLHINEQPLDYWCERFRREGFALDAKDEALRSGVARLDLPWWYAANIRVFSRRA